MIRKLHRDLAWSSLIAKDLSGLLTFAMILGTLGELDPRKGSFFFNFFLSH